jgi:hypothetical protein
MPPEASSNIDYATGTSPAADTRADIWSLTPEQATEILQQRAADFRPSAPLAPTTAHDANVRLTQLMNDVEWARKLMSGDIATRDEFQRLSELKAYGDVTGDAVADQAPVIETTIGDTGSGSLTRSQMISAAEDMRAEGTFNEDGIALILNDGKFPTEDVRAAQYWLGRMERNPELLYPDLGDDREQQMRFLRAIAAIGDGSTP